jgi:thiamine biosynthesis protein ThiS
MVQVNGEPLDWQEGLTVRGVLRARKYIFPLLVVTLDGRLIRREDYDSTPVPDGATVSVVHLMSGG